MLAINVSVSRNTTYTNDLSIIDKNSAREYWADLLMDFYEKHIGKNIGIKAFLDYVKTIQKKMNAEYRYVFQCNKNGYDGEFRLAHAQKSLSVFLKHLWCMEKMKMPPLCPIDGVILHDVLKRKGAWTKLNDWGTYMEYIRDVWDASKNTGKKVAEWEYDNWNMIIEEKNSKKDKSKKQTSQQEPHSASKTNTKQTSDDTWNDLEKYSKITDINQKVNYDELLIGYIIPIEEKPFYLFVAHKTGKTGYFCQLRYYYDDGTVIMDIDTVKTIITNNGDNKTWTHNQGKPKPTFKYVSFGDEKIKALLLMKCILEEIRAPQNVIDEVDGLILKA